MPGFNYVTQIETVGRNTIIYRSILVAHRLGVHQSNGSKTSRQRSQHGLLWNRPHELCTLAHQAEVRLTVNSPHVGHQGQEASHVTTNGMRKLLSY